MDEVLKSSSTKATGTRASPIPFELLDMISDYASTAWTRDSFVRRLHEKKDTLVSAAYRVVLGQGREATTWIRDQNNSELIQMPPTNKTKNLKRLADALFCNSYWLTFNGLSAAGARWVIEEVIVERELLFPGALFYTRCLWLENTEINDVDLAPLFDLFARHVMPRLLWVGLSGCNIKEPGTLTQIAQLRLSCRLNSLEWIELAGTPLAAAMEADTSHPSWADYKILRVMGTQIRFG